ncbi:hypothetical protein HNP98_000881 [Hymenobacter sp. 9A]|uniref:Uncharacterized protein n=1 Tax=Hymenobacter caeli TaxID=2735894 RepID=A0ABX2FLQ8_9BACT|nr:hypothetical protein [Hymenobacter caeli]
MGRWPCDGRYPGGSDCGNQPMRQLKPARSYWACVHQPGAVLP